MAFFDLSRGMQILLIASGIAAAPMAGCGNKTSVPVTPKQKGSGEAKCADLSVEGLYVSVTKSGATRSVIEIQVEGTLPCGTTIDHQVSAEKVSVVGAEAAENGRLEVEIDTGGMKPGDTGSLAITVKAGCGHGTAVLKQQVVICKQAGGIKILEGASLSCEGVPPAVDGGTVPDVQHYIIVDPPPPPYDPPPPPYDPLPPPPPMDPAPYPEPYIVDCVPDKMDSPQQPGSGASAGLVGPGSPVAVQARIVATRDHGDGSWMLVVVDRGSGSPTGAAVRWMCGSGNLSERAGSATRWIPPEGHGVHAVMAAVERDGTVAVETLKIFT